MVTPVLVVLSLVEFRLEGGDQDGTVAPGDVPGVGEVADDGGFHV